MSVEKELFVTEGISRYLYNVTLYFYQGLDRTFNRCHQSEVLRGIGLRLLDFSSLRCAARKT